MAGATETPVELSIIAGLPYARRVRVEEGTLIWPDTNSFELHGQVRVGRSRDTQLLYDLRPYMTGSIDGADIVVDIEMTGAQTRTLVTGYYDVIISDPGDIDARALPVLSGKVKVSQLVTETTDD